MTYEESQAWSVIQASVAAEFERAMREYMRHEFGLAEGTPIPSRPLPRWQSEAYDRVSASARARVARAFEVPYWTVGLVDARPDPLRFGFPRVTTSRSHYANWADSLELPKLHRWEGLIINEQVASAIEERRGTVDRG